MDKDAAIGHIDPQIGDMIRGVFPAPSWIYAADAKKEGAEDSTLIMSEISRKALKLTRNIEKELLQGKIKPGPGGEDRIDEVIDKLVSGELIHNTPSQPVNKRDCLSVGTYFPNMCMIS